jgi:DNA-binding GntR family transcriptional regulator
MSSTEKPKARKRTNSGKAAAARPAEKSAAKERPSSLAQRAYEAIKEKIITLFFVPGQYLNEGAICELLGLGRTPVHQALQRLQADGLVEVVPRKGVIIQPESIGQILETLDARTVIETELVRRAAEKAKPSDVAELTRILDRTSRAHGGGTIDAFVETDRAFHVKIAAISGNQVLADLVKTLHERSTRSWYLLLWQTIDVSASEKQHRKVLNAIAAGDPDAAAAALQAHVNSLRKRLMHLHNAPQGAFHLARHVPRA